jgi:hypothetical protein
MVFGCMARQEHDQPQGSTANRSISGEGCLSGLRCKGSMVQFRSCRTPVYASWFKLKRARREFVWRYVISIRPADGESIRRWGRRRWRIEGFFKTIKSRFAWTSSVSAWLAVLGGSLLWRCWRSCSPSGRRWRLWAIGSDWIGALQRGA